jgi:hypothetical protein
MQIYLLTPILIPTFPTMSTVYSLTKYTLAPLECTTGQSHPITGTGSVIQHSNGSYSCFDHTKSYFSQLTAQAVNGGTMLDRARVERDNSSSGWHIAPKGIRPRCYECQTIFGPGNVVMHLEGGNRNKTSCDNQTCVDAMTKKVKYPLTYGGDLTTEYSKATRIPKEVMDKLKI